MQEILHEVTVCESLLMLLTSLELADEYDISNAFISFVIPTALSEN